MRDIKSLYVVFGSWATVSDLSYTRSMTLFCSSAFGMVEICGIIPFLARLHGHCEERGKPAQYIK